MTAKGAKSSGPRAVLRHIDAHELRVEREERFAVATLELLIGRGRESARDGVAIDVGHALETADDDDVVHSARDREIADPRRRPARRTCGFDRDRFDAAQARVVGDQPAELALIAEHARHHVADVQRADARRVDARVRERRGHGGGTEVAAAHLGFFVDRRLAYADDVDVSQADSSHTWRASLARMIADAPRERYARSARERPRCFIAGHDPPAD